MKTNKGKQMKKKTVKKVNPAMPYEIGEAYIFVTVTRYYTGILKWVGDKELVITNAAWIAHTDRYNAALTTGVVRSVEPIPGDVIIGRGCIVEVSEWHHALPSLVK
jgi:hypothetical protein